MIKDRQNIHSSYHSPHLKLPHPSLACTKSEAEIMKFPLEGAKHWLIRARWRSRSEAALRQVISNDQDSQRT